jgi:hypothetical protein
MCGRASSNSHQTPGVEVAASSGLRRNLTGGSLAIRHPLASISMQRQNSSARSR